MVEAGDKDLTAAAQFYALASSFLHRPSLLPPIVSTRKCAAKLEGGGGAPPHGDGCFVFQACGIRKGEVPGPMVV
jgi:hypothetical protein